MKVTFDPAKRAATLIERHIDFEAAGAVFAGDTFTKEDTRFNYGERRFQTVGLLDDRMVMIVWAPRADARHIISMRKCNAKEQALYKSQIRRD